MDYKEKRDYAERLIRKCANAYPGDEETPQMLNDYIKTKLHTYRKDLDTLIQCFEDLTKNIPNVKPDYRDGRIMQSPYYQQGIYNHGETQNN